MLNADMAGPDGSIPRNFLTACILLFLKESPAHGYDLLQRLRGFGLAHDSGGLYRTLRALEGEGLLRSAWESGKGRGRRSYLLTPAGNAWLDRWVHHLDGHRRTLDRFATRYQAAVTAPAAGHHSGRQDQGGQMTTGTSTLHPRTRAGLLSFVRYGFMPNRLGYCGPDQNSLLFQYGVAGEADRGLPPVLTKFLGPLPYLRTIASAAGIGDIFDERVVEAYWVGNDLLERIHARDLASTLTERFRKELNPKIMNMVAGKVPQGARPHHSFHVFDVWRQVGRLEGNVLASMDSCRISWGTVRSIDDASVLVDRPALRMEGGKLALGPAEPSRAIRMLEGRGFVTDLAPGDLVSMHWGWICERISVEQAAVLERYTRHHLRLANQTI